MSNWYAAARGKSGQKSAESYSWLYGEGEQRQMVVDEGAVTVYEGLRETEKLLFPFKKDSVQLHVY